MAKKRSDGPTVPILASAREPGLKFREVPEPPYVRIVVSKAGGRLTERKMHSLIYLLGLVVVVLLVLSLLGVA